MHRAHSLQVTKDALRPRSSLKPYRFEAKAKAKDKAMILFVFELSPRSRTRSLPYSLPG